jgi:tetratricopeptide (TPR) repeat protein
MNRLERVDWRSIEHSQSLSFRTIALLSAMILGITMAASDTQAQSKTPLSKDDVITLLKRSVKPVEVGEMARKYGIAFRLTPGTEKDLHEAGANDDLLNTLRKLVPPEKPVLPPVRPPKAADTKPSWEALQKAVRLKPDDPNAHSALAERTYDYGIEHSSRPDDAIVGRNEAIAEYREAVRLGSDDARMHYGFGKALACAPGFKCSSPAEQETAISEYRRALQLKPDWAEPHTALGDLLSARKDWSGAVAEYREVVKLRSGDPKAHAKLGEALTKIPDWAAATEEYRKWVSLMPNDASAHYYLGSALAGLKQWDDVVREMRKTLSLNSSAGDAQKAHILFGYALYNKGDLDGAIAEYHLAGISPEASRLLGDALYDKKDWQGAAEEYYKSVEYLDGTIKIQTMLKEANARVQAGEQDLAIFTFNELVELDPNNLDALNYLCQHKQHVFGGPRLDAMDACRHAIALNSGDAGTYNALGWYLAENDQFDEAIIYAEKSLQLKPGAPGALDTIGFALAGKGQYEEAISKYQEALRGNPNDQEIQAHLAAAVRLSAPKKH